MWRNRVVLLIAGLGGVWLIGPLVTGMLLSRPDIDVDKEAAHSSAVIEPTPADGVSPFDVVETGSDPSQAQVQTDLVNSGSMSNREAVERSLRAIVEQPLSGESETALLDRLQAWSVTEPAETALWIERTLSDASAGSVADALVHPLLYLWVEIEPEVALARLGAFADEDEIPYLMLSHAERLSDDNTPVEALEWARSIEDKASSELVVDGLLQRWLERDVTTLATQLESDYPELQYGIDTAENTRSNDETPSALGEYQTGFPMTDDFRESVAAALVDQDPARALRWAESLPSTNAEAVRIKAFDSWLVQDPVAASDWLSGVLTDTGTLPASLASSVPEHDIDLAINTLPLLSGASQGAMTSAIVETLSEVDSDDARAWVDGLVDPQERSAAVTVWARANAERQPAEALEGALESTQGPGRLDVLVDVAATVAQVDQPLLESWLAAAPLSDYERSQIASVVFDNAEAFPFQ